MREDSYFYYWICDFGHFYEVKESNQSSKTCQEVLLKFGYSEKATKFEKIFHLKFDVTE